MRANRAMLLIGAAVSASAGCQALVTLEGNPRPAVDAATEPPPPPQPPSTATACSDDTLAAPDGSPVTQATRPIELVFSYLSFDTVPPSDAGVPLCESSGFDLAAQPCERTDGSACRARCGDKTSTLGKDNAAGQLLQVLRTIPAASDIRVPEPTEALAQGDANLLVRILDYHQRLGEDDAQVTVELFGLTGLADSSRPYVDPFAPDGAYERVDAGPWAHAWDRATYREWSVQPDSFVDFTSRRASYTGTGFIKGNVLVAHATQAPVSFSSFVVMLDDVTLTGELRRDDEGRWSLVRGRLGGDVAVERLRVGLPLLVARNPQYCETLRDQLFGDQICPARDRGPAGGPCDALSVAGSFAMVEGKLGLPHIEHVLASDCGIPSCPVKP